MSGIGSAVEKREKSGPARGAVDRETTCPLLLRVFCATSRHNPISEYMRGIIIDTMESLDKLFCTVPNNETHIYTWLDATLKELTGLVQEVNPEARSRGTYFDFALVYPDLRTGNRYISRDIGTTVAGQKGLDDQKTLSECKFNIGDYLDIAITPPTGANDRFDRMNIRRFSGPDRFRRNRDRERDRPF